MYFKTMIKKVTNEVIKEHKKFCEENDYYLEFGLETLYRYEDILLTCTKAINFKKYLETDREDLEKDNEGVDEKTLSLWLIADYVLAEIEWKGLPV